MVIVFEFNTPRGLFRDALHLAEDHNLTDAEIEAMKQERVDNWIAIVSNPHDEITVEDASSQPVESIVEEV
jgi:hypothetical protein